MCAFVKYLHPGNGIGGDGEVGGRGQGRLFFELQSYVVFEEGGNFKKHSLLL